MTKNRLSQRKQNHTVGEAIQYIKKQTQYDRRQVANGPDYSLLDDIFFRELGFDKVFQYLGPALGSAGC